MILNTLLSRDLLIDAYKFHSRGDARAHDAIKIINKRDDMDVAVKGCLEQALKEEDPNKQNLLVQAARYGKMFYPGIAIEEYPNVCRLIRVRNHLRRKNINSETSIEQALEMLVSWKEFALALWIVHELEAFSDSDSWIRRKWCEFLIDQHQMKDDQIATKIKTVLGDNPQYFSYADVANYAIRRHRNNLAIKLTEYERHSLKRIPLLLNLDQNDLVLAQALASCDSNIIYMTIFKLKESILSEIPFRELLKKHRLAFKYYCNFLAVTDIQKLILISAKDCPEDELYLSLLGYRFDSASKVAKDQKLDMLVQQLDMSKKLLKFQATLTGTPRFGDEISWIGLSVSDTIINLIATDQISKAKDAQRRFEVSDKKFRTLEQIATNTLPKLT